MRTFLSRLRTRLSSYRGTLLSVAAHLTLLACLAGGLGRSAHVAPYRLPGTAQGVTLLTYYSPGSVQPVHSTMRAKSPEKTETSSLLHDLKSAPKVEVSQTTDAQAGVGSSAESGLGEGDITIALESYFPHPKPDLSGLPHGTKGDVVLNAVIDENGNIAELTLLKGLGSPIDETVIATVRQWRYTPAKKNGVPVVSEQELHFHYERG